MKTWKRGWLVLVLLLSGWAWAGPTDWSASLVEPGKVGKLDQNSIPDFTTLVPNPTCALGVSSLNFGCAPTATTNSLVYLDQRYGSIYGRSLIPRAQDAILQSDLRDVAVVLGTRMNTHAPATYFVDFLLGKESYIESVAPGKTDYDAQMDPRVRFLADEQRRGIVPPSWMQQRAPTIDFLLDNLKQDEDIELVAVRFGRDSNGNLVQLAGHYTTLLAIHWIDTDMDGVVDRNESATLDFMDPNGGVVKTLPFSQGDDALVIELPSGSLFEIVGAATESPRISVPEPATWLLVILGFFVCGLSSMLRSRVVAR